jgi:cation diffusion facilitator CzcD-associated flavoprotein CzcO
VKVLIVGAGFSGLCLGIRLRQAGISDFLIFEKSSGLGGTWHDNHYPGAACDAPSHLYSFSFDLKPDWSRKWASQAEIRLYMEACARRHGLLPHHVRFGREIASARFDAEASQWHVTTRDGEAHVADFLVSGVGQLSRPYMPDIPGLGEFAGEVFHSARWNHDCDLAGRRVAVLGNAASAIQFVPEVARKTKQLYVLQRSANWMFPKRDYEYSERTKRLFARVPGLARLYRWWIYWTFEMMLPVFRQNRFLGRRMEALVKRGIREQISDPELRRALVPDYPIGGKRILISDDYYATLARSDVELVTSGVDRVTRDAVVTRDARRLPVDAIILATGFETNDFLAPIHVEGPGGRLLADEWKSGARAHLGITVAGFPNLFLMYGPNTNLGHNSIVFMIECQARYILDCLAKLEARGGASLDLRRDVMDAADERLQQRMAATTWSQTGKSWYKNADGRITNNWPGSTVEYWWKTRRADLGEFRVAPRRS